MAAASTNGVGQGQFLDSAPELPNFVIMETNDSVVASGAPARAALDRIFAYVSAARLSSSAQRRWEAIHAAIRLLWDESRLGRSVTGAQLDQLFGIDPSALQSVLPQLLYFVLTHSGSVAAEVKSFLLRTCATSPTFGYELHWLLLAQPRRTTFGSASDETVRASLIEQMKQSVSRLLDISLKPPQQINDTSTQCMQPDAEVPSISQFRRELHLVQTLTSISEQLRTVDRHQRQQRLQAALNAVNKLLPHSGAQTVPSWRPFVPLSGVEAHPHAIVRFLEDEAFVLSTKERVPYLVFVETVDADPALWADAHTTDPRTLGAMARISRLSRAVASRAATFARRPHLSFERMPSGRRPRADSCNSNVVNGCNEQIASNDHPAAAVRNEHAQRARSISDSGAIAEAANNTIRTARDIGSSRIFQGGDADATVPTNADCRLGDRAPPDEPVSDEPAPDEPAPDEPEMHHSGMQHLDAARAGGPDGSTLPLRSDENATRFTHESEDDDDFDYTISEGFGELWQERIDRLRLTSPFSALPGWTLHAFIVKSNDELLQEQFAVSLIREFDRIFRHSRLPLRLRPYRILATSPTTGLIEVVPNAKSLDSVKKSTSNYFSLADFFRRRYGGASSVGFHRARRNFVQSVAAYSVVSYLLQLKDRHNGNILLHANGSVIHIDFGFLLSNSPGKNMGFEAAPFKLTGEWVELMGGVGSPWFRYYRTLVVRGFQEARRHREKLLLIVQATYRGVAGSLACFRAGESTIDAMRQRFQPGMTQQQYARYAANLIENSLDNWTTGAYDCYQRCCLGIL